MSNLKLRRQKFIEEYMKDGNATRAYLAAGFKCNEISARTLAAKLLANVGVQHEIQRKQQEIATESDISIKRLLQEEKCLAFNDLRQIFKGPTRISPAELPEEVGRALSGIDVIENETTGITTYKYRFWDKGRSLERLERFMGMFKDKGDSTSIVQLAPEGIEKPDNAGVSD